ncbi:MAG: phosphoglucosamine mutase [Legionellales bacterium]|nr:phosphoglucosamine mutase [Legionellales bacterium]
MERKYFGTDGIRGEVGQSLINPEFVLKLGWAVGRVLANKERRKVLIGKDTRVSGYLLESALQAGLSAAGVDVKLLGPMPTPAIAYLTRTFRASIGIVISASHNLFYDNGIKFFGSDGQKLSDKLELAVEQMLDQPVVTVDSKLLGKAERVVDAPGRYIEFCKSAIASEIRLNGLKIVVDCANGATYHVAPTIFQELGAQVIDLATRPDGFNINDQCGSTDTAMLQQAVVTHQAHLGIAFDGDGDRVIMVDEQGRVLDGDDLLYIMIQDRLQRGLMCEGVVGTVMSNYGFEMKLAQLNIPLVRSQVGDRFVLAELVKHQWLLGGEPSGHIICLDKTTTGDGIICALQVLSAMQRQQQSLAQLTQGLNKLPQVMINVESRYGEQVANHPRVCEAVQQVEAKLNQSGRVLLRASGTQPLVRVMVEGKDRQQVESYAQQLAQVVAQIEV